MRLRTRLDRLAGRIRTSSDDAPSAVIYLPDNGRGDGPFRSRCVVVYDPADPPPEVLKMDAAEGGGRALSPGRGPPP